LTPFAVTEAIQESLFYLMNTLAIWIVYIWPIELCTSSVCPKNRPLQEKKTVSTGADIY